jgi:hypothetical protein
VASVRWNVLNSRPILARPRRCARKILHGDGTGLRFETGEHGGDYPDNMPQAITVTDVQGGSSYRTERLIESALLEEEAPT